jgi:hypothetical protein
MLFGGGGGDDLYGFRGEDTFIDDDTSTQGDIIETGGDSGDVVYTADGASDVVDCGDSRDRRTDALVFADNSDDVVHCGRVIRVSAF